MGLAPDDVEDILQDTYLRLFVWGSWRGDTYADVVRVARVASRNLALDLLRDRRRYLTDLVPEPRPSRIEDELSLGVDVQAERRLAAVQAFSTLTERERAAVLRDRSAVAPDERNAFDQQLFRARSRLLAKMKATWAGAPIVRWFRAPRPQLVELAGSAGISVAMAVTAGTGMFAPQARAGSVVATVTSTATSTTSMASPTPSTADSPSHAPVARAMPPAATPLEPEPVAPEPFQARVLAPTGDNAASVNGSARGNDDALLCVGPVPAVESLCVLRY